MKNIIPCSIFFLLYFMVNNAFATIVNLSFNPGDWSPIDTVNEPPDASFILNSDNNLQATLAAPHGGTAARINRRTDTTYNFQNSTLRFKWKVNSNNYYSAFTLGVGSTYVFDPNAPSQVYYSTNHSWLGSEVITSNMWVYSQVIFNSTSYDYTVSYEGYGVGEYLSGSVSMSTTRWDNLANDYFFFSLGDNYYGGTYLELDEAYIVMPEQSIPEPATLFLLGSGLIGMLGLRKIKR